MDYEFEIVLVAGVVIVGLLAAIGYYSLRFFFKAGRYEEEVPQLPAESESSAAAEDTNNALARELLESEKTTSSVAVPAPEAPVVPTVSVAPPPKKELSDALSNTRANLFGRLKAVFVGDKDLNDDDRESLEEILYTSDLGPKTVQRLLEAVDLRLSGGQKSNLDNVRAALRSEILDIFSGVQVGDESIDIDVNKVLHLHGERAAKPLVWLIVGVNGVGKTTTIGKLANTVAKSGLKVLVAAGDTFRAAAGDQLKVWSERAQVEIFSPEGVSDPSAVAFDACQMAKSRDFDVVIIDTAGRLHTQANLMDELRKMKRVVQKVIQQAPHETLLVLDANSGQNALVQARNFHDILELSGVVLTKMDGTAKGGVAVGLACELELPIRLIGVGEGIDDLRPFCSQEFVNSIL